MRSVLVGLAVLFTAGVVGLGPARAQQDRGPVRQGEVGGFVRGDLDGFSSRGGAKSWVFEDDKDADASAALDRAARDVESVTRDSRRMMDSAADAAAAADRMDQRMGEGSLHRYLPPEGEESILPGVSRSLSGSGVVIEDRGQSSATVTTTLPKGTSIRP